MRSISSAIFLPAIFRVPSSMVWPAGFFAGASILMIGGWGSFRGYDGHYEKTPLASVLPVSMSEGDDRIQGAACYRIEACKPLRLLKGLDFSEAPPIAGYNRVKNRARSQRGSFGADDPFRSLQRPVCRDEKRPAFGPGHAREGEDRRFDDGSCTALGGRPGGLGARASYNPLF